MTRPMPGPPDWYDIDWHPHLGMVWIKNDGECDETFSHAELDKKRLTSSECAAEYWRAAENLRYARAMNQARYRVRPERSDDPPSASVNKAWREKNTWHRFATTPHALESGGAAS